MTMKIHDKYLIGPKLKTKKTMTAIRHTALRFGAVVFSTEFLREK